LKLPAYGTIKYFERTQRDFRIMNRFGLGATVKYIRNYDLFSLDNTLSAGGDLFYQSGPVESYLNINGARGDILHTLTDETISNAGFFISNHTDITAQTLTSAYSQVRQSAF
jgi:hypothetical protein